MDLVFDAKTHAYTNPKEPAQQWTSITSIISLFHKTFDKETQAVKSSNNPKSKWYKMSPQEIIACWDKETERSVNLGHWYHTERETETSMCDTIGREGLNLPIFQPIAQNGLKIAPLQTLVPGIYPEHFMYLYSAGICGQADRVEIVGEHIDIYDYKTGKEIKTEGYTNWEGITTKMFEPISHLDDCNLVHYSLQLSFYMYMITKHNYHLKPRKLLLHHIKFEIETLDQFGYPVIATGPAGDPIVKEVVPYELPYLRSEVMAIIDYIKLNPQILCK